MVWEHSGPGDREWREKAKERIPWKKVAWKKRNLYCLFRGSNWYVLQRLYGAPLYKVWKAAYLRLSILSSPFQTSHPYPVPALRGENAVCERSADGNCQLVGGDKKVRHCTLALGFFFPQCLQFRSHNFSLRKFLFLENLRVSYKIKLFRELICLSNQCFSFLTKKGKYWHHQKELLEAKIRSCIGTVSTQRMVSWKEFVGIPITRDCWLPQN